MPWRCDRVRRAVALGGVVGVVEQAVDGLVAVEVDDRQDVARARTTRRPRRAGGDDVVGALRRRGGHASPRAVSVVGGVDEGAVGPPAWRPTAGRRARSARRARRAPPAACRCTAARVERVRRRWRPARAAAARRAASTAAPGAGGARRTRSAPSASTRTPWKNEMLGGRSRGPSPCLAAAEQRTARGRRATGPAARRRRTRRRCAPRVDVPHSASWRPDVSPTMRGQHPALVAEQQVAGAEVGLPLDLDGVGDVEPLPRLVGVEEQHVRAGVAVQVGQPQRRAARERPCGVAAAGDGLGPRRSRVDAVGRRRPRRRRQRRHRLAPRLPACARACSRAPGRAVARRRHEPCDLAAPARAGWRRRRRQAPRSRRCSA